MFSSCNNGHISHRTGHVANGLYVCGLTWSPVYLLASSRPVLFESGFSCAAGIYEKDLIRFLGRSSPDMLFITHGHWDHCGTAAFLKRRFPGLKIAASPETEMIVSRPGAQRFMTGLGSTVIPTLRALLSRADADRLVEGPFEPFRVDIPLDDGQAIQLAPDLEVRVFRTPGHTRDHMMFYIPEREMVFGGEAAGCLEPLGGITAEFLVDYDAYVQSLRRLITLHVEVFCLAHHFVLLGRNTIRDFLKESLETTERFAERLYRLLDEEGDNVEPVLERLAVDYHITDPGLQQPLESYLINLRAQLTHLQQRRQRAGGDERQ
jgi:glyoxylase-like metal-dependent hydrolase (beta-lactamase superfamily II)